VKLTKSFNYGKNPEWACHFIFIITFCSRIRLHWFWWRWKADEKYNKNVRSKFFLIRTLLCPNCPAINCHKSLRIWNIFLLGLRLVWLGDLFTIFLKIPRASRDSLIPIKRPPFFEEKGKLWRNTQALRKNQRLHQEGGSF
jgi:hypothetical protein